jgi:hypothetical protein
MHAEQKKKSLFLPGLALLLITVATWLLMLLVRSVMELALMVILAFPWVMLEVI